MYRRRETKMRTLLCVLSVITILLVLSACGNDNRGNQPNQTIQSTQTNDIQTSATDYGFVFRSVILIPGSDFVAEKFPEPQYTYTRDNSVLGGKDTFLNYTDIEVTVHDDGIKTVIHRIVVISPDLKTPEGLALGDPLEQVTKLYGDNYVQDGDLWLFSKGETMLAVLTQDGFVAGIEYGLTGL